MTKTNLVILEDDIPEELKGKFEKLKKGDVIGGLEYVPTDDGLPRFVRHVELTDNQIMLCERMGIRLEDFKAQLRKGQQE